MTTNRNLWQLYQNPAGDVLHLTYTENNIIRRAINVVIQDAAGKTVERLRAAYVNKQLYISVSRLHAGFYFITIEAVNDLQPNAKFIKN